MIGSIIIDIYTVVWKIIVLYNVNYMKIAFLCQSWAIKIFEQFNCNIITKIIIM